MESKKNGVKQKLSLKNKKDIQKKVTYAKQNLVHTNTRVITDDISNDVIEKRNSRIIIVGIAVVFALAFLFFLGNKTFFRNSYANGKLKIQLPVFMYFSSDKDNVITFKTLRKSENVKKYFDEYLSNLENFDYYNCPSGKSLYYNDKSNIVVYDINVTKGFALKTIKIYYDIKTQDKVCEEY